MSGHTIDIDVHDGIDVDEGRVEAALVAMLDALGRGPFELSVVLTDDATIATLNATWRDTPMATDVLSFPQQEPPVVDGVLGDIVVSVPYAARQAASVGHGLDAELRVLFAHAIAHLVGHDHHTDAASAEMAAVEAALLDATGGGAGLVSRATHGAAALDAKGEPR